MGLWRSLGARFHGMEEVVGSIPTRSTNQSNNLARASVRRQSVCVTVCVITRHFAAIGEGLYRFRHGFHADVRVSISQGRAPNWSRVNQVGSCWATTRDFWSGSVKMHSDTHTGTMHGAAI